MGERNHREYYHGRIEESRRLAAAARDPRIGAIHTELAQRYEDKLAEAGDDGDAARSPGDAQSPMKIIFVEARYLGQP